MSLYDFNIYRMPPNSLPKGAVQWLLIRHDIKKEDYVIAYDEGNYYINTDISIKDSEDFKRVLTYEGKAINDENSKVNEILERVYNEYGSSVFSCMIDAYTYKRRQRQDIKGKSSALMHIEMIDKYIGDNAPDDGELARLMIDAEYLIHYISYLHRDKKAGSINNLFGIGKMRIFVFAYLLGKGQVTV